MVKQWALRSGMTLFFVDVAIAPLLTEKIDARELSEPELGTLIFHPSPLPYGRGASSIRWAYRRRGTNYGGNMVLGRHWPRHGRYLRAGDRQNRLRSATERVLRIGYYSGHAKDVRTVFERASNGD